MSGDRDRLLYWPTHLLTIAALLPHFGCGRWGPQPSVCRLPLTLAFLSVTNWTATGTCLYSFITPTWFRLFFYLFTPVHLWLTARSRVNIQHKGSLLLLRTTHLSVTLTFWHFRFTDPFNWAVEYGKYIIAEGYNHPSTTSVLDMTLNHLIARLQSWSFLEYGVPLHCYYSRFTLTLISITC